MTEPGFQLSTSGRVFELLTSQGVFWSMAETNRYKVVLFIQKSWKCNNYHPMTQIAIKKMTSTKNRVKRRSNNLMPKLSL